MAIAEHLTPADLDLSLAQDSEARRHELEQPHRHELFMPRLCALYTEQGQPKPEVLNQVNKTLEHGHMIVIQYGGSYGLTFNVYDRYTAARARKEKEALEGKDPVVVGIFATKDEARQFLDPTRIAPEVRDRFDELLDAIEVNAFLLIPIKEEEAQRIPEEIRKFIVQDGAIQLWIFADDDPMTPIHTGKGKDGKRKWIGVRSVNPEGLPEALTGVGVAEFARQSGATMVAFLKETFMKQDINERERYGSFPIIDIVAPKDGSYQIAINRKGNLSLEALFDLFKKLGFKEVVYREKKTSDAERSDGQSVIYNDDDAYMEAWGLRVASYGFIPPFMERAFERWRARRQQRNPQKAVQ